MDERDGQVSREGDGVAASPCPRIVALTHEFSPVTGGIAIYTQEVARAAAAHGCNIEVWAPQHPDMDKAQFNFPVRDLPADGDQSWPSRLRLARCLLHKSSQWKNSVIWLPEPGPMRMWMYFNLIRRLPIKGLVLTLHGSEIELFSSRWHRRKLFARLLADADRISVVSRYCRDSLLQKYPEIESKVVIAHGALRADVPGYADPVDGSLKNGRIVILTVGRIHPRKGQLAVVEALGLMEPELRSRFVYRCVGPRRREKYLHIVEQAAKELGVAFEYAGEVGVETLNEEYRHADIFAMTSDKAGHSVEGFGLTYLEASAYGLPIVAHRTGGVADAVREGFNGLKVDPEDRVSLAGVFKSLARDKDLRSRLGENGRRWARGFSWGDSARTLFEGVGDRTENLDGGSLFRGVAALF
ncbi:MAG TPA: glycosyltransferase family 4 protein [Opitutales bacterium]|nr:glycosyltransferase family 4 protein [Opitutales bacterium]